MRVLPSVLRSWTMILFFLSGLKPISRPKETRFPKPWDGHALCVKRQEDHRSNKSQDSEIVSSLTTYKPENTWPQSENISLMPLVGLPITRVLLGLGRKMTGIGYSWSWAANGNSLYFLNDCVLGGKCTLVSCLG